MDNIFSEAFEAYVKNLVKGYIAEMFPKKDRFTPADLAERYGFSLDVARQKIRNGEFGEVIHASERRSVVTLEGVMGYEMSHKEKPKSAVTNRKNKKNIAPARNPGRI